MATPKKIPLMQLKINPKEGSLVTAIALVGSPAIESNFIAFSKSAEPMKFEIVDGEKMELLGAAMIPDFPMYRNGGEAGEYMATFDSETIREISQQFAEKGFFNNMNIDHDADKKAGSYVSQSYIVDSTKGMNAPTGFDLPDGTWMIGVKVVDPQTWQDVKDGKTKGFSVEGIFALFDTSIEIELTEEERLENEFIDALYDYLIGEED